MSGSSSTALHRFRGRLFLLLGLGLAVMGVVAYVVQISLQRLMPSREGAPAGSIELRVSPSPSKIPYGGFSPVRLQMDRQWRPSTKSRGLSAVHIRPVSPSYTPPQLQLPGIRDPRRDYPFENLSVQCGTPPNNWNTSIQRPLARHRVMLSRRVIAYYGLMAPLNPSPPLMDLWRGLLHPRKIGLRWNPEGPQFTPLDCARVPPPIPRRPEECD